MLRLLRKLIVLLLLAIWMPVTLHCDLEAAELALSSHGSQHETVCDVLCTCDGCAAVEDGAYRPSEDLLLVPPILCCSDACCLACLALLATPVAEPVMLRTGEPQPEALSPTWCFVRRAAPSPRAPSCVIA